MRRHISQREAHALAKRVEELEAQARVLRYKMEAPHGGIALYQGSVAKDRFFGMVEGAAKCGKIIVVRVRKDAYHFYAC